MNSNNRSAKMNHEQNALSGLNLNNITALLSQTQHQAQTQAATAAHQQAQNQMAAALQAQQAQQALQNQAQQQAQAQAQQAAQHAQNSESNSLPWPIFQPTVNVPYFDINTYQKVNLDVQASALPSGMDLPLHDMNTLRFFFNFGVHHARAILLREHFHITPNSQGNSGGQTQLSQAQAQQAQNQQSAALLSLQQQDQALYQQAMLKNNSEALANANASKSMGGQMPGTNAATDPNLAFQLQRDLSTSLSINQLQNTLAQMNKMSGQVGQTGLGNIKNEQIEALLMQNSMLGQQGQGMQFRIPNSTANVNQSQQQTHPEGLHRPTAVMPSSIPLGLTAGKPLLGQSGQVQTAQQQLLGGLGISAAIQQQVPVDPAPRVVGINKPTTSEQLVASAAGSMLTSKAGVANPVPLTSSVLASFLQEQQANDRMKPTSLVRGAVSDIARPVASIPASSASPAAVQNYINATVPSTIAAPVPASSAANGNGMSLAAQLSIAMLNGAFFQEQKQRTENVVAAKAAEKPPLPAGLNIANDNPDAHLLAATSPYVKLLKNSAEGSRSITAGTSANAQTDVNTQIATTSAAAIPASTIAQQPVSAAHPYLVGPFGGADLDPTTFLAATELNYTEAFRRSHDQRDAGTPENQRRKSGIYMLPGGNGTESQEDPSNKKKISTDKPLKKETLLYVNNCLNQLKSQVQSHGLGVGVDANFRPIDYSSRPIDAIFRKAREQLDRERDLTQHRSSVSPALLHRIQAGNNPTGQDEQLGQPRDGAEDGSSSAPATASSIPQNDTVIENGGRSKSEQPAETKPSPESIVERTPSIPTKIVEEPAKTVEITDDGAPDAKRAKIEESSEPKTEST